MNFSLASSSLVTGNHRYTGKSANANKAAELLSLCSFFFLPCLGSDCLQGSFSSEPMRKWRWKCQWGEERKYSGYKNQIFVSGLLPSCKCPLLGASQCVCSSTSKTGPLSLKGKIGKEVAETQCGLYHLRTPARHWQLRNTTTYIRCHAVLKTNAKNDSRHTVDV